MVDKLRWAVTAGDQIGDSQDDQKCGDHYIEKGLECHDGDAHRPTPGKNPYWQGDRKGSEDKSRSSKGRKGSGFDSGEEGTPHDRDKSERTERSQHYGKEGDKQKQAEDAVGLFDHYADMMEEAWEGAGDSVEWTPQRKSELIEMVMRDVARDYSLDAEQLGFMDKAKEHYGPVDNYLASREKGSKGRSMSRPRYSEKPGTTTDDTGRSVMLPTKHGDKEGLFHETEKRTRGGDQPKEQPDTDSKPLPEIEPPAVPETPEEAPEKVTPDNSTGPGAGMVNKAKDALRKLFPNWSKAEAVSTLHWGAKADIAYRLAWSALNGTSLGRPCGDGEDPEVGKCNPNTRQRPVSTNPGASPGGPPGEKPSPGAEGPLLQGSDSLKALRDRKSAPPKNIGVGPEEDASRAGRTQQDVARLSNTGGDAEKSAWAVSKMFPGSRYKRDGKGNLGGGSVSSEPAKAKRVHDDTRAALEGAGWTNTSDMGGRSGWSKDGVNVLLSVGKDADPKTGKTRYINRFSVSAAASEKEDGDNNLPFPGAVAPFKTKDEVASLNWG